MKHPLEAAFETTDVEAFLWLTFPVQWRGIAARILESGYEFATEPCEWAPRWSRIPLTVRRGATDLETAVKPVCYRVHDCLHQLWGLPTPTGDFSEDDRYVFKRAGMCGEVAVLALEEFLFCSYLYDTFPETQATLWRRNALPMWREGPLRGKTIQQIAVRLDGLLHKKLRPKWVREDANATAFADDDVPMLEDDRTFLDRHWEAMRRAA